MLVQQIQMKVCIYGKREEEAMSRSGNITAYLDSNGTTVRSCTEKLYDPYTESGRKKKVTITCAIQIIDGSILLKGKSNHNFKGKNISGEKSRIHVLHQ